MEGLPNSLKEELEPMVQDDSIEKVEEPADSRTVQEKINDVITGECIVNQDVLDGISKQLDKCPNISFKGGYNYNDNYAPF